MWQLDKSSNYIEALIFNLNSRLKSEPSSPMSIYAQRERKLSKLGLAEYYLQFCAVNSQLSNHSGALISARKSLDLLKN
jgi:CII-binding regulator of phage lambda lysogenization HflD